MRTGIKSFNDSLPQAELDLVEKTRSNLFTWRGQFSPELIHTLLTSYCPEGSVVLDPFCGSGTVLYEAGALELPVYGIELNPAAYLLSRTYELIGLTPRSLSDICTSFYRQCSSRFPSQQLLQDEAPLSADALRDIVSDLAEGFCHEECILLDAFVILLDIHNRTPTPSHMHGTLSKLIDLAKALPHSSHTIKAFLGDARALPLDDSSVDFVVTSPPYINVFNYHQNYRRSAELLGWDLLSIARSEIGSNRANRGNRFLTVIQYCCDMARVLFELHRVASSDARMILVVGHESAVLGVPFENANIISAIASDLGVFDLVLRQSRTFTNKFGKSIREDLLHFEKKSSSRPVSDLTAVARQVAERVLREGCKCVCLKNQSALAAAIEKVGEVSGTRIYAVDAKSPVGKQEPAVITRSC